MAGQWSFGASGLKEDDTYLVVDARGQVDGGETGVFRHDTRFLSRYVWHLEDFTPLLVHEPRPDTRVEHWAHLIGPDQAVGLNRVLKVGRGLVVDRLVFENTGQNPADIDLRLTLAADFADLFEVRGWMRHPRKVERVGGAGRVGFRYLAGDGLAFATWVELSPPPVDGRWRFRIFPREKVQISAVIRLLSPLEDPAPLPLPDYDEWRAKFPIVLDDPRAQGVLERAVDDLRALLLATPFGPYPAAGIPWFVAPFGRDGLLSAYMLLPFVPEVAEAVLRFLAAHQGRASVPERDEAPGKIPHELRKGELTRLGEVPFGPYYGTVDATPLFLILLHAHMTWTGSLDLVEELREAWEAALWWMIEAGDADGDGLLEFSAQGQRGLSVQSWKDSSDSMTHASGELAEPPLAVSEVQGYAYRAYKAAAEFYRVLGEPQSAGRWAARAEALREAFHRRFWLGDLATYALALDRNKRPLRVLSSDPGQLLWSGIVPASVAPRLVGTLFSEALWSGWGLRTLGTGEQRYNPLSYHNGSVWPHDTALFAGGLAAYGFRSEAQRVAKSLFELALSQADRRLPELVGGYPRRPGEPPVPYPSACRPQAWDAAAAIYLLRVAWDWRPGARPSPPEGFFSGNLKRAVP